MVFIQLKIALKNFGLDTLRTESDYYMEAVIKKDKLTELHSKLFEYLGSIAWPSDKPIPSHIQKIADNYGGVRDGQTLYYSQEEKEVVFALLWPWSDGEHITIKTGKKEV
jgi:hypothetical protein